MDKKQANYQLSIDARQCATCNMFQSGSCELVEGIIEPYAVCDYWIPQEES
jgi:hypothetical protein